MDASSGAPRRISSLRYLLTLRILAGCLALLGCGLALARLMRGGSRGEEWGGAETQRLLLLLAGCLLGAAVIWFFSRGYAALVYDAGDALLLGRRREPIRLSDITAVEFVRPQGRGGVLHARVHYGAHRGFAYLPRDTVAAWSLAATPEPASLVGLRERVAAARAEKRA